MDYRPGNYRIKTKKTHIRLPHSYRERYVEYTSYRGEGGNNEYTYTYDKKELLYNGRDPDTITISIH